MKSVEEYSTSYMDNDLKTEDIGKYEHKPAVGIPKHDILRSVLITVAASEMKRSVAPHEKTIGKA